MKWRVILFYDPLPPQCSDCDKDMSVWHEPEKKDISFSKDGEEIHAYLYSDDSGAVYVSLKTEDVLDLLITGGVLRHGN